MIFGFIKKIFIGLLTTIGYFLSLAIRNVYPQVIKNAQLNLLLLSYVSGNRRKDYITIHLQLN